MTRIIRVRDDYGVEHDFYVTEGDQQMVGISENSITYGKIDPRTCQIIQLNRDFARPNEQKETLEHELFHGVRNEKNETDIRYGLSVDYNGMRSYRNVA
jgi:hypothetical protein